MRALLVCCLVALAVCQESVRYDNLLNPKKQYEYQYEGQVKFGLVKSNHAQAGARMKALVKIIGTSSDLFHLEFTDVTFEEFNGLQGSAEYVAAAELSKKISDQLRQPIAFTYSAGNVGEIRAPETVKDLTINIVRGVLSFFQVTVKTSHEVYELVEVGLHGKCQSSYAQKIDDQQRVMRLTQVVDVTNCREKAAFYTGLATAVENKISKQSGESLFSTVEYSYNITGSNEAGEIKSARALELQFFTPFNVKKGSFMMEAEKKLVLIKQSNTEDKHHDSSMQSRGSLKYKLVKDNNANIPVVMQNLDNPVVEVKKLIKHLAQANAEHIDSHTTEKALKVYQLLRKTPRAQLDEMWREMKENRLERNWFLHSVVEVNDEKILDFLDKHLKDLDTLEAITVIIQAFNHLEPTPQVLEEAKKFLTKEYRDRPLVRQTVLLSYGSLVYKHCAYHTPCPEAVIRPIVDMVKAAQQSNNEKEQVLLLKTLGNAGHPRSLKAITEFLPGVNPNHEQVANKSPRVVSAAVQAMRLIAIRDPHEVQTKTLQLFLNREAKPEIRMLAFMIMFDTKPSMALVSTVTSHLLEERDMQVVNFAHTYLRNLARSSTPDNTYLTTAASVAARILSHKYGRLSYTKSSATRMDWFDYDYLIGAAAETFILKRASQIIPPEMMVKMNFYFIGRILQVLEVGIRPEALRDLIGEEIPGFSGEMSQSDFQAIYEQLKKWETLPEDKPIIRFHARASGQEFFFSELSKQSLVKLIKSFSQTPGRESLLFSIMEKLNQGFSWRGIMPFLLAEARYIQPSTIGLPVEISKYYHVVSAMSVNVSSQQVNSEQVLASEIPVTTKGYVGYNKNMWLFYGINTEYFQSAVEIKTTSPLTIPLNFRAKVNIQARHFELEIPLRSNEIEVFSFRSDAHAISRNIMHPNTPKMTPIGASDRNVSPRYSQVMQKAEPNKLHKVKTSCVEASTYGLKLCTEMDLKREYFQDEYPLYYFLGSTRFALKVKRAQEQSVDKIRLVISRNSKSSSVNVRQLIEKLREMAKSARPASSSASQEVQDRPTRGIGGSPVQAVQIQLLAEGSSGQRGYDIALLYTPEEQSYSTQMIVSDSVQSSNWKMCADASVHSEAKLNIAWGQECQSYGIFMSAGLVSGARRELKARASWRQLPESMEMYGRSVARYIPGIAYLLDFNQEQQNNGKQQISASIIAASADSIDVKIKLPELTLCREAIPSPVYLSTSRREREQ